MNPHFKSPTFQINEQIVANAKLIGIYVSSNQLSFLAIHITQMTKTILAFHKLLTCDPRSVAIAIDHKSRMEESKRGSPTKKVA